MLALEGARIAAMGFDAAKHIVYPNEIETADAKKTEELRARYLRDYESAAVARAAGLVDEVVAIGALRARLAAHLGRLAPKPRAEGRGRAILP